MTQRQIFSGDADSQIWLEGSPLKSDENILITLTSISGEKSAFISKHGVKEIVAAQLVDAAPEVQSEDSKESGICTEKTT